MHKQIGMIVLLALGLTMLGCGSGSHGGPGSGNINGTWMATLTNLDGSPAYTFSTTFTQNSGSSLSVTSFTLTSTDPCIGSEKTTETGSFGLTGNFNGSVQGSFTMTITGTTGDVLSLTGTVVGNTISGSWILAGGGCSGQGLFNIHPPMAGG